VARLLPLEVPLVQSRNRHVPHHQRGAATLPVLIRPVATALLVAGLIAFGIGESAAQSSRTYPGISTRGIPSTSSSHDSYQRRLGSQQTPSMRSTDFGQPRYPRSPQTIYDNTPRTTGVIDDPARIDGRQPPRRGTTDWVRYCQAKYRSFNASTGMYRAKSGEYRPCR
jgi:BA14K-like protein